MPEQNGPTDPSPSDLDDLEAKLKAARDRHAGPKPKDGDKGSNSSLLGMAWRLSTELLASVLVGFLLGYGVDVLFGTGPWGLLVGLGLGIASGFMSVFRTAAAMDERTAHIPIGDDLPDDEDEMD